MIAEDKIAVLRLAASQNASDPKPWFAVVSGAAPREPDALMNFSCMLVPLSASPAVALRFPDFAMCASFKPQASSLPIHFANVVAVGDGRCRLQVRTKEKEKIIDAQEQYVLVRRHVDFTSRATIAELERCAAAPQDLLFARLLSDDAKTWCETPGWKANELAAALDELERIQPSLATVSQKAGLGRVLARRCCIQIGPPGAGKTHWGADTILRVCRAADHIGVALRVLVTACTHSALECLLEKLCVLRRAEDAVRVLKCDADAKRPSAPGQSCWVTLRTKAGKKAQRYITAQREAGVIIAASADGETLDVRLDGSGEVRCNIPKKCFRHRHAFEIFAGTGEDVDAEIFGTEGCVVVGATTHRAGKKLAAEVVQGKFNVLLIDEASKMLPSVAALAIKALNPERGRLVILGDPKQMRPTIRTQLPEDTDVGASILDLAVRQLRGSFCLGRLDENHRMCPQFCDFTETALGYPGYCICSEGGCTCRPAVPLPLLNFTGADATLLDEASPLVVVELAGNGAPLADLRTEEAACCADLVRAYDGAALAAGRARGAFVVTPHHAQRLAVSAALGPLVAHCTIDTVERMQGRERDLVIVCFAGLDLYGDDDGVELDFVYDACRVVVALTRAKRKCVVLATERLFDPSMYVFDTPARREAYHLLLGVRAYADGRGAVVPRALAAPFVFTAVVPRPPPQFPPPPAPPPAARSADDEELVDLSQALSLNDGRVTTPDSDDETILEEEVRAPPPTKRDRTAFDEFLDADDYVPPEWVAPPKTPTKRARKVYCCSKCGRPKRGHDCPFD
jgi:hypothetical protein